MQNPGPSRANFGRVKDIVKKFGPFIITGLAAVAEHHWHEDKEKEHAKEDEAKKTGKEEIDSEVRKLKKEIKALRKSMRRRPRGRRERGLGFGLDVGSESCESEGEGEGESLEVLVGGSKRVEKGRGRGRGVGGGGGAVRGFEQKGLPEIRYRYVPPRVPSPPPPPPGIPPFIPVYQRPTMDASAPDQTQDRARGHHRRRRHHRESSLPPIQSLPHAEATMHITKAAAIAGALEGIHVATAKGDWVGPKGVRVGTAMAAAAGTSYVRGKREAEVDGSNGMRTRDMVVDVGTGLLVSRLVHGSSRRLEKGAGEGQVKEGGEKRRWSHFL